MNIQNKAVFLIVAVIFMLTACAGLSLNDRLDLAMECGTGDECDLLWEEYNTSAARLERRRERLGAGKCGSGMVLYCNANCTATRRHGKIAGVCVPTSVFIN